MRQRLRLALWLWGAPCPRLGDELRAVTAAGADYVHIDVMDGHFVPNITIGPSVVKALRPHSDLPFDVHLMIAPVDPYIAEFAAAGADIITVHPESGPHLHRTIQLIKSLGKKAGVALNPATAAGPSTSRSMAASMARRRPWPRRPAPTCWSPAPRSSPAAPPPMPTTSGGCVAGAEGAIAGPGDRARPTPMRRAGPPPPAGAPPPARRRGGGPARRRRVAPAHCSACRARCCGSGWATACAPPGSPAPSIA